MWTDTDYHELVEDLSNASPREVAIAMDLMLREQSGDPRVIPLIERYLHDRTVTLLWIPLTYGELRWRAAEALSAEYTAQNLGRTVILEDAVEPLTGDEIGLLVERHGIVITNSPPELGGYSIAAYQALRDGGFLPRFRIEFAHGTSRPWRRF
jgi:hypothetical protein